MEGVIPPVEQLAIELCPGTNNFNEYQRQIVYTCRPAKVKFGQLTTSYQLAIVRVA